MTRSLLPILLVLPLLLVMVGLVLYPAGMTVWDSLHRLDLTNPGSAPFVGLENYGRLLRDSNVRAATANTLAYLAMALGAEVVLGLGIALVLNRRFWGRGAMLAIVILPWALPPVANGVIWKWIYNPQYGVLNGLLEQMVLIQDYQVWLGKPVWALLLVTLVHVWKMMPLAAVIFLAALQTIPHSLYEAAGIDGAGPVRSFFHVTLPLLRPSLAVVLTQGTIGALNLFDEVWVLTGTALSTRPILLQNYLIAFRDLNLGYGMALSLGITLVTLLISGIYVLFVYREVEL